MAKNSTTPASAADRKREGPWEPPTEDTEFVFDGVDHAPGWVDKNWASFDRGPALAVPVGDIYSDGPYTTQSARIGDTVKFVANKGATAAHFEVIRGEPDPAKGVTKRVPQQSAAQEEDLLKGGWITPDDLGEDAKAQIISRSPHLRRMIEDGHGLPKEQKVSDIMKTS
jgi:hypothetical protein